MAEMNPEHLDPDTAPSDRSIWKAVDCAALERQAQAIFAKQHVAGRCSYARPSNLEDDRAYPIPLEVEKAWRMISPSLPPPSLKWTLFLPPP